MNRVLFNGEKGTVRYQGKLIHKVDNSKIKVDEEWLGVEWDLAEKGKHNGVVEGVEYFKCEKEGNAGSLVMAKKAEFGQEIVEALIRRYFRDHEVNEILRNKHDVVGFLKEKWEKEIERQKRRDEQEVRINPEAGWVKKRKTGKVAEVSTEQVPNVVAEMEEAKPSDKEKEESMFEEDGEEVSTTAVSGKETRGEVITKLFSKIKDKDCYTTNQINSEYDEDAYINTFNNRFKRIEFKGFDKIWERIYHLDKLIELCLSNLKIQDFGSIGSIGRIASNLRHLTLENNLLYNWNQILVMGAEFPRLETLSVSYNNLKCDEEGYEGKELHSFNFQGEKITLDDPKLVFPKLSKLIAIETGLTFKKLDKILAFTPILQELVVCKNSCNDFENIDTKKMQKLTSLNLEENKISNDHKFGLLGSIPNLRNLALNQNQISRFQSPETFLTLESLNLSHNIITEGIIITDLSKCPTLKSLKINYNPIEQSANKKEIGRRAVAEISTLTRINGMDLGRFERKDCEYYFLRWVFHEFFTQFGLHQLSYKFKDFEVWAQANYPAVFQLIKKHENPYPEVDVTAVQEDKDQVIAQAPTQQMRYIKLIFSTPIGPMAGNPPLSKTFPKTTDFLYIRNWVSQIFKLPNKELITIKFRNSQYQVYEDIDDMTKNIEYYDLKENADVIVDEKY